jgi:hypothetical protein
MPSPVHDRGKAAEKAAQDGVNAAADAAEAQSKAQAEQVAAKAEDERQPRAAAADAESRHKADESEQQRLKAAKAEEDAHTFKERLKQRVTRTQLVTPPTPPGETATPLPMDDSAIEAEVAKRAKPAEVKFEVETKMAMGQVYEAKLEILRPGGARPSLIKGIPEINERVQILNKARATISSAHLKIERLLPEWQEIPTGGRGYWTWKVEPQKAGKTQLLVLVEHAGTFDKIERIFNVEQFPRTIEIEVGFWQSVGEAITGVSPSVAALGTMAAAVAGLAGIGAGAWAWIRGRRREAQKDGGGSHESPVT